MYRDGMKIYEIAEVFGIHHSSVADIIKGKAWKHLPYDKIENNLRKKSILRIKGEEIKEFTSITEAAKEFLAMNKSAHSAISACCRGKKDSYMGYKWCYIDNV